VPNLKLLIIDDELKALALMKVNLEAFGYEVLTAATGNGGIVLALKENPDIILLDIRLPDMSGWEVCRMLKSISNTRDIPIVFQTAYSEEKDIAKARSIGAVEYLIKPVDPDKLQRVLREIAEKKSGMRVGYNGGSDKGLLSENVE
jgi:CheY-like chemotaxis protein